MFFIFWQLQARIRPVAVSDRAKINRPAKYLVWLENRTHRDFAFCFRFFFIFVLCSSLLLFGFSFAILQKEPGMLRSWMHLFSEEVRRGDTGRGRKKKGLKQRERWREPGSGGTWSTPTTHVAPKSTMSRARCCSCWERLFEHSENKRGEYERPIEFHAWFFFVFFFLLVRDAITLIFALPYQTFAYF